MGSLLLRLAAPIQSYAGYRLLANSSGVPTAPMPSKSAIAGLLGACLGRRDLQTLMGQFDLHVRVDRANPVGVDLQILHPMPEHIENDTARYERMARGVPSMGAIKKRPGGSLGTAMVNRDFLAHSEFLVSLTGDDSRQWLDAVRDPVFMPYLGRRAAAPTFPFVLGHTADDPVDVFAALPRARRIENNEDAPLRIYRVTGSYTQHQQDLVKHVTPPHVTRTEQLEWLSLNL